MLKITVAKLKKYENTTWKIQLHKMDYENNWKFKDFTDLKTKNPTKNLANLDRMEKIH